MQSGRGGEGSGGEGGKGVLISFVGEDSDREMKTPFSFPVHHDCYEVSQQKMLLW